MNSKKITAFVDSLKNVLVLELKSKFEFPFYNFLFL